MRAAEYVFAFVRLARAKKVFGNPGTTELPLLRRIPGDIQYVLSLHDGLAVGMAEGAFLISGRPQFVSLHGAIGLSNAIGYIRSALMDRAPLLVLVGQQHSEFLSDEPLIWGDILKIARPVVKDAFEVRTPIDVPKLLTRALKVAVAPPWGPAVVSLPFDIVDEDVKESPAIPTFSFSILCEDSSVQEVASWLTGGSKVAIVAGYEVDVYMAHEELRTLAERISATVFAEPNAHRSPFYSSHPLFEGDLPWEADEMLKKLSVYDRILIVGGTLNFLTPPTEKDFKLNIFQVTSDPEEAEKRKWNTICCNVKEFLTKLNSALPRSSISLKIETERPKPVGTTIINFLEELASNSQDREKFAEASSLMGEIRRTMGYFPSRFFGLKSGLLGWSLTAAVGAALEGARPLVLIGDGGFHYSCQSLWTASNYGATELRAVVFNNRGYEILRRHFRDEPWLSPLTSPYKVAEAYGVEAKKVGLKEASKEISWLVRGKGPKLLQVDFA